LLKSFAAPSVRDFDDRAKKVLTGHRVDAVPTLSVDLRLSREADPLPVALLVECAVA
jgi:hypothetical protein